MKQEVTDWIAALRSGKYQQGKHALVRTELGVDHFCCLGVLCSLKGFNGDGDGNFLELVEAKEIGITREGHLKESIEALGEEPSGRARLDSLAELNDAGLSFSQIADFIEAGMVEGIDK